jgi:hypothetical protein
MFAIRPSLVYLCRQLLEASRLRHFVLRSLQNGSTDANAATVTQDNFFEHGDSCNADVCMSALRPDTPGDAGELLCLHLLDCTFVPFRGNESSVSHRKPMAGK